MSRVNHQEVQPEYNQDPEELQEGEETTRYDSWCGICLEQIYAPILKGIWYHRRSKYYQNHPAVEAEPLMLLYLELKTFGVSGQMFGDDDNPCPCIKKWYDNLMQNIKEGFYGTESESEGHYYMSDGWTICKFKRMELGNEDVTDPFYPVKQSYLCEDCLEILVKKKRIKITPNGKSNNILWNTIEWLSKDGL